MAKFTLGADPEFFLTDSSGTPVSAHNLVPGTKKAPHSLKRGAAVQADGTAVEFNIKPCSTGVEFQERTLDALEQIRQSLSPKFKFSFSPAVFFEPKYFDALPNIAKELGCEPDFNGANGAVNPTPMPMGKHRTMRTAAGHIHFGFTNLADIFSPSHRFDCQHLACRSDYTFRPLMRNWDYDKDRILLYGRNAAYRPKHYGMEYRALSVAWLKYPLLYPFIFDTAKAIYDAMEEGVYYNWTSTISSRTPKLTTNMLTKELKL